MHQKVVILFGGISKENNVSVASAQNLAQSLENPILWYWGKDGSVTEVAAEQLLAHKNAFITDFEAHALQFFTNIEDSLDYAALNSLVIFNALHGIGGEDGYIQELMEKRDIRSTGSSAAVSRLAFNKDLSKQEMSRAGIMVPRSALINSSAPAKAGITCSGLLRTYGALVVKPVADGSSFGLSILKNEKELKQCIAGLAKDQNITYLVEEFIEGIELTVGIIESKGRIIALEPIEIAADADRVFDYEGKYLGQGINEILPARISNEDNARAKHLATVAHQAMGCSGYSRTDMILNNAGIYFLEINTLPGLTQASLVPQELAAAGISMAHFVSEQLSLAGLIA